MKLILILTMLALTFTVYSDDNLCFRLTKSTFDFSDKQIRSIISGSFSKDKSKFVVSFQDLTTKIYDINSEKEEFFISEQMKVHVASFSDDNRFVVMANSDHKVKVYDLKERKELHSNNTETNVNSITISPDNSKYIISFTNQFATVHDLKTGELLYKLGYSAWTTSQMFSADSSKILLTFSNGFTRVYSSNSGEMLFEKKNENWVVPGFFSKDNKKIIVSSGKETIFYDAISGIKVDSLQHKHAISSTTSSKDGSYLVTYSKEPSIFRDSPDEGGEIRVYDEKSNHLQTTIKVGNNLTSVEISPDNSKIITFAPFSGSVKVYDRKTGELLLEFKKEEYVSKSLLLDKTDQIATVHDYQIEKNKMFCFNSEQKKKSIDCDATECDANEKAKSKEVEVKPVSAKIFLCKASLPKGFNPEKDIVSILKIIESRDYEKHEAEIAVFLQSLFVSNPLLYEDLVRKYPKLQEMDFERQSTSSFCKKSKVDMKKFKTILTDYIKDIKVVKLESFDSLLPLAPLMQILNPDEQEKLRHIMTQKLTDVVSTNKDFEGISYNKLRMLIYEATAPFFGVDPQFFTDLSLVKSAGNPSDAKLILYSSFDHPIDEVQVNDYGFYTKTASNLVLNENGRPGDLIYSNKVKWKAGSDQFSANVKVAYKKGGKEDFLIKHASPDYDKLWKNGLNGLVVLGTNIKSSVHIMDYYLSYYKKEGFSCGGSKELKEIKDQKKFITKLIESGKIDYFIKEAHSDGDEKNMFYLDQTGSYLTCVHKNKNESVILVFPNIKETISVPLSNLEFSEVMEKRTKSGGEALIYFNTSCSSAVTKAGNEVESVANKNFINIPALNEVTTFSDRKDGAERLLFTSFRNKGSYQDMRNELMKNPDYKNKTKNHFIFPDEADYEESITSKIKIPLDTRIEIYDNKSKRYYMDRD